MPRGLLPAVGAAALLLTSLVPALAPAAVPATSLTSAGSAAAASVTGSLTVSPSRYVAGQAIRFHGNLGASGSRQVHLEAHMGRPGDTWREVPSSTFRTDSHGAFDFVFRAPAMFNISYRVVGGGLATRPYLFTPSPQEITLAPLNGDPDYPFHKVRGGATSTVFVDTTPPVRSAFGTPPPIPGRTVLLQERVGSTGWRTIGTKTTDRDGHAYFTVKAPESGTRVLRARQKRYTEGRNEIGWFASFPAYFVVSGAPTVHEPPTKGVSPGQLTRSAAQPTASGRYGWGPSRFDYAWEAGQDLGSPPSKGDVRGGRWRVTSNGTGRATPFNGGLVLQSKLKRIGSGDRGTTTVSLKGGGQAHGRWEFRMQGRPWEIGAQPYRFRLELVPVGAPVTDCPPESVVIADFTMGKPGMRFGVRSRSAGAVWHRTLSGVRLAEEPFTIGVEVGKDHLTWFRNSNPIGTVLDTRAQLGARLVPRLSLIGAEAEMNGAQVNSDWQRSWTLQAGRQVRSAERLTRTGYSGC